jgi:glutamyl-tRNA synthetase
VCRGPIAPAVEEPEFLAAAAAALPDGELDRESWSRWTERLKETTGRKGKALFLPLRRALTGLDHGPELRLLLPLIGRERALRRLRGETA